MSKEFTNKVMKSIAASVDSMLDAFGVDAYFTVLLWTPGGVNYVGNTRREDTANAMRELMERWDNETGEEAQYEKPLIEGQTKAEAFLHGAVLELDPEPAPVSIALEDQQHLVYTVPIGNDHIATVLIEKDAYEELLKRNG